MIMDLLRQEHRNIETLLLVLEQELSVFDRGGKPDYEVISAILAYFEGYHEAYHHPREDELFERLKLRDPETAAKVGALDAEHRRGAERLRRVAHAVEGVLMDQELPRQSVGDIIRAFIKEERAHIAMEEDVFFPAAEKALLPEDWSAIAAARAANRKDPLFSEEVEERFDALRRQILKLEEEAKAERS